MYTPKIEKATDITKFKRDDFNLRKILAEFNRLNTEALKFAIVIKFYTKKSISENIFI